MSISSAPLNLIFHLKRFDFQHNRKVHCYVLRDATTSILDFFTGCDKRTLSLARLGLV